jgi:hypothetical protein
MINFSVIANMNNSVIDRIILFGLVMWLTGCASNDAGKPFNCSTVSVLLTLVSKTNVSSCTANDGRIEVTAANGQGPYEFRINGGAFSTSGIFENLTQGTGYTIEAKDANGCIGTLSPAPSIDNPTSTLAAEAIDATNDTECLTDNGSFTITASGGTAPYTYKKGNGPFTDNATFGGLASGNYTITVKDKEGCTFTVTKTISKGDTGVSWSGQVKNIIDTKCAISTCHNGSEFPDLRVLRNVQNNKAQIRSRTQSGDMPRNGTLTNDEKTKIACWVDDGAKNN